MSAMPPPRTDENALRRTLGQFPTGVAVVTALGRGGAPVGVTVSSFNSVSMDPPLVLFSLALGAGTLPVFRRHPGFVVNVLAAGQEDVALRFARPGEDRFRGLDWRPGLHGSPVMAGVAAVLECSAHARHPGGDHEIFLGRVDRFSADHARAPLLFAGGRLTALPGPVGGA